MKKYIAILFLISICLIGCRDDFFFSETREISDYSWDVNDVLEFDFPIEVEDTSQLYMWFIDVRHTADFEFANFYMFPKRISPDGKTYTDTLNIPLANPAGKWYGKGAGDIYDNRVLWLKDVKFPSTGKYKFTFEQGSRESSLDGIVSIGFSMYKYQP